VKKPGPRPTAKKDRGRHQQSFDQQSWCEQSGISQQTQPEQHESAGQKYIRAAQDCRIGAHQFQICYKKIQSATAADRADGTGDRRQNAGESMGAQIDPPLQSFDSLESIHQKDTEDQSSEQENQPVGFDFGEHPCAEDYSGHHPQRQHPGNRPIGITKPLRQQMNLRDAGCERHQQDRMMRPQHPGGEEDDRHVGAESQSTSNIESDEMDQKHKAYSERRHAVESDDITDCDQFWGLANIPWR